MADIGLLIPTYRRLAAGGRSSDLPAEPGSYMLVLRLNQPVALTIGRLGTVAFPAGYYVYAGSALGPGGLAARVGRHLRREKRLHWHIDYLLEVATVVDVRAESGSERRECAWARRLLEAGGAVIAPGFGASDCRCATHLVYLGENETLEVLKTSRV